MNINNNDDKKKVKILYSNHRGETGIREIIPYEIIFKSTDYHPKVQWLLRAFALDRKAERYFALSQIEAWFT